MLRISSLPHLVQARRHEHHCGHLAFSRLCRLVAVKFTPKALILMEHGTMSVVMPNVRAKRTTTAGHQGPLAENVQRTCRRALVACRWRSA